MGIYITPPHWTFTPLLRSLAPPMARNFRNSDGAVGAFQKTKENNRMHVRCPSRGWEQHSGTPASCQLSNTESHLRANSRIHLILFIVVTPASQLAKRALLVVMRALASLYSCTLTCHRDSTDQQILTNCRKLALRAHPDHGVPRSISSN